MVSHPFAYIVERAQKRAFALWLVLTVAVMAALQALGTPLQTASAPLGIISFEFTGTAVRAQEILLSWGPSGQVFAGLNLGLDYLFLVSYAGAIGLGCVLTARSLSQGAGRLRSLGVLLAWGLIVAALLDSVENYALIRVLLGSRSELWPSLALWCAIPKFLLVGAGLVYILAAGIAVLWRRVFRRE